MASSSMATELHTFNFSGEDVQLVDNLAGLASGTYTSVGVAGEITVNISANLGVLDFTTASGNLGIDPSTSSNTDPHSITLDFSSLSDSPIRIHSVTMTSIMEIGSPFTRSHEFVLDPNNTSQAIYRYDNSQSILLGSYHAPQTGGVVLNVNNLQYGYHSIHSITVASESMGTSVPEPATALLFLFSLTALGFIRIRWR
jgi:hypothetical protein